MSIGSTDAVGEWQRQLVALLRRTLAEWCIEIVFIRTPRPYDR